MFQKVAKFGKNTTAIELTLGSRSYFNEREKNISKVNSFCCRSNIQVYERKKTKNYMLI